MVDAKLINDVHASERQLAIGYAPKSVRPALKAVFALDDRLGTILRSTRQELVGQMRLTWWSDALQALDVASTPAEPVLIALAEQVLPRGVEGKALAKMVGGWERLLLSEDWDPAAHAQKRGARLFRIAARLCRANDAGVDRAGRGWALADLSVNLSDPDRAEAARQMAIAELDQAMSRRWSSAGRAVGALALSARFDCARPKILPGSPRRVARLLSHRMTGL